MCVCPVAQSCTTPWTVVCQAPLSMRFPRQEYWSGLPFSPPGDLPSSGLESRSPTLQADGLLTELCGNPPWSSNPLFGLPRWLSGKDSACQVGDVGLIPGLGRFPREGNGNPLQYSCLGKPMDRGACWATVHRVPKS